MNMRAEKTLDELNPDEIFNETLKDARSEEVTQADPHAMPDINESTAELSDFLTDFESSQPGADVRIYRIVEGVKSPGFIFNFPVGSKSYMGMMRELQRRYPDGGDFMMNVLSPHGRHSYLARKRFRLEPSAVEKVEDSTGLTGLVSDLMRRMDERMARTEDQVQRVLERMTQTQAAAAPLNPVELLKGIAETMKALTPAPVAAPERGGFGEMAQMMEFYRELREEARSEVSEGDESLGQTLLKSLPKLVEVLPALRGTATLAVPDTSQAPLRDPATPVLPAASATSTPATGNSPMPLTELASLTPYLELLNAQARADNDPETYAHLVIDHAQPADLATLMAMPDLKEKILTAYPAARQYAGWWEELIECIQDELRGDNPASGSASES